MRSAPLPSDVSKHYPPSVPTHCSIRRGTKGQQPGEPLRKQTEDLGWEPHIILGLQVPGLLAQEAKDIGEVLVTNLIKHLQGE